MRRTFTLIVLLMSGAWLTPAFSGNTPESHRETLKTMMIRHGIIALPVASEQKNQAEQTQIILAGRDGEPLVYQILTKIWQDGAWVNSELQTNTYDEDGNILLILMQTWIEGAWVNSYQLESVYDPNGQLTQNLYHMWDADAGAWQLYGRSTPSYDPVSQLATQILVEMNFPPFGWVNASVSYFTYNDQDLITLYVEDSWSFENMAWEHHSRIYYTYNGENYLIEDLRQYWVGDQYQDGDLQTYTYDGQGQLVQKLYEYFGFTREWLPGSRTTYSYNGDGLQSHELEEMYSIGVWQNSYQITFTYDAGGNLVTELRQSWGAERSWQNSMETTYTYTTTVGIDEPQPAQGQVKVYPNPAAHRINFECPGDLEGEKILIVTDQKGSQVARIRLPGNDQVNSMITWQVPGELNNGIYIYRLDAGGQSFSGQVLISR